MDGIGFHERSGCALIFLIGTSIPGCMGLLDSEDSGGMVAPLDVPEWEVGDWWLYTLDPGLL